MENAILLPKKKELSNLAIRAYDRRRFTSYKK